MMAISMLASIINRVGPKRGGRTWRSRNHLAVAAFPSRAAPDSILPPELTDHIIDYLYYDSATLKSCSLVCSSWLPTSRLHLWSNSHIILEFCPPQDDLEDFLKTSPHITSAVRSLHIRFSASGSRKCVKDELKWMKEILIPIIQSMNNLKAFYISGRIGPHMADFFNNISAQFASVVSVKFISCQFETFPLFSDFVWSFPALTELTIQQLAFSTELHTGVLTVRDASLPRPPLERLKLHLEATAYDVVLLVTTWMVGNGLASHLSDVGITQDSPSASGLRLFVHMVGTKLKNLNIESISPLYLPLPGFSILTPITHCTNLETLTISAPNLEWLLHIASPGTFLVASPYITKLVLKVTKVWESEEELASFDWNAFCGAFECPSYIPAVCRAGDWLNRAEVFLEVIMETEEGRDAAKAFITRRLGKNHSRLRLLVDCCSV